MSRVEVLGVMPKEMKHECEQESDMCFNDSEVNLNVSDWVREDGGEVCDVAVRGRGARRGECGLYRAAGQAQACVSSLGARDVGGGAHEEGAAGRAP